MSKVSAKRPQRKETLWERHFLRIQKARGVHGTDHVRAELDRLARQVRKIKYAAMADLDGWVRVKDVLALIKDAKK